jgi:hypothetical protein
VSRKVVPKTKKLWPFLFLGKYIRIFARRYAPDSSPKNARTQKEEAALSGAQDKAYDESNGSLRLR